MDHTSVLYSLDVTHAYRNIERTLQNLRAGDIELATEDLVEIAQLLEKYRREGA